MTVRDPQESTIRTVIAQILAREGGIVRLEDERFTTYFGQTPSWLKRWRLPIPTSAEEAGMNYRQWIEDTNLDALCTDDDALPDVVIDFAIHSGESAAIRSLQRALRVDVDGIIGPETMTMLMVCDRDKVAARVLADRIDTLAGLITDHPEKYGQWARGWFRRVSNQVRVLT